MINVQILKEKIAHKHILLDTGIFSRSFDHFDSFRPLFQLLNETNCQATYFPLIKFELLRDVFINDNRIKRQMFVEEVTRVNLPIPPNLFDRAISFANEYTEHQVKSASLVDCCIAAYLEKYADNLFLITLNHKDFPTFLFDRIFVLPIDTDKDVFPLGFYAFNKEKAKQLGVLL